MVLGEGLSTPRGELGARDVFGEHARPGAAQGTQRTQGPCPMHNPLSATHRALPIEHYLKINTEQVDTKDLSETKEKGEGWTLQGAIL